ncbi:uncharacterized protein LTR77_011190 [Saxophila tyrrhenica]|uniref:Telomere-associated protein Rif1 N-terminal domain-containing protein n=1 Tax=Saxophila tyrrhenica TaxID=1690608 RepID=A0AAV9NT74_9PEZI|nr:hypothetical protein LTR77_011190 [Saxophila tyrrhenica]
MTEQPPTPPRDISKAVDDAIKFLDDSNEIEHLSTGPVIHTATTRRPSDDSACATPSSSQENAAVPPGSRRVDFSPHPRYHSIAPVGQASSPHAQLLKWSPSRNAKPVKSILKRSHAPPPTPDDLESKPSYFSPTVPGSFNKMLQSVLQQLAGPSRSARLDSYQALLGAFKVYKDPPDVSAMQQKMDTVMQFIARDMAWKTMDGKLDKGIISQALYLTGTILANSSLSGALDDDFRTFLIDRSIVVLEQPGMPKPIMKTHAHLMGIQQFHSSLMTPGKAEKLLSALQTVEERCTGNGIVTGRLLTYNRLLEQAPNVMLSRISDWLPHVFHGMLSSIDDTRKRAIETCTTGGLRLGTSPNAAKALEDLLRSDDEEGENYLLYLSRRLSEMVHSKENGKYAPKIWAAVVLFYRSKRKPLERWPKFKACWLSIIQDCFNSSDIDTRREATLAWNKLVFATMPDASTSRNFLSMLQIPISSALNRRVKGSFGAESKRCMLDCYYNLLHYGLRPGLSLEEYDAAWEVLVEPILSTMIKLDSKSRNDASRILHGLLSPNPLSGEWNAIAALGSDPIKVEELPMLQPRWVRSRIGKVLRLVETILEATLKRPEHPHEAFDAVWKVLMHCTAQAGAQEVKTTSELKEAIALLVSMLRRIWQGQAGSVQGSDFQGWIELYTSVVATMAEQLGSAPLVEDILAKTDTNGIEVAPTPSQRLPKHQSAPVSPMVILLGQYYHRPAGVMSNDAFRACFGSLLQRFVTARAGPSAKVEFLRRSLYSWVEDPQVQADPTTIADLWMVVADVSTDALQPDVKSPGGQESQHAAYAIRNALEILTTGLHIEGSQKLQPSLANLYNALLRTAKSEAGDGGVVIAVMEPLAKAILDDNVDHNNIQAKLQITTHMLREPAWPRTRQAMEQSRKALWGAGLPLQKASLFDPFDKVYSLIVDLMTVTYNQFEENADSILDVSSDFVTSVICFLQKAPVSLLPTALRKVQDGFVVWVEAKAMKTSSTQATSMQASLTLLPLNVLKALEPLLAAGFASPHRSIVNETILFWNETFGSQQSLAYPLKLEAVLRARLVDAEIDLPGFPESGEDRVEASLPEFFETQSQLPGAPLGLQDLSTTCSSVAAAQRSPRPVFQRSLFISRSSPLPGSIANNASPSTKRAPRTGSSTPKARLRHNDSQVQFAPIEWSSPFQPAHESQVLTEHQKEVKARQLQNAQLFPDLSSSPVAQSTALPKHVPRQLNFTAHRDFTEGDAAGTPTGLPDGNVLPSDDIPSSPTPSSTRAASQGPAEANDDDDAEDTLEEEPPSSPPQVADDTRKQIDLDGDRDLPPQEEVFVDTTIDQDNIELPEAAALVDKAILDDTTEVDEEPPTEDMVSASEFPSDSHLPEEQLQLEAEEAARREVVDVAASRSEADDEAPVDSQADPARADQEALAETADVVKDRPQDVDISRVENSFIEHEEQNDETASQATEASQSQSSQKSSRKRRRSGGVVYTAKKARKQQSPLKRIWSSFVGGTQQDDDDLEEEIVVASSQRVQSPEPTKAEESAVSQEEPVEEPSQPVGEPAQEEAGTMQPPPKRGRGRPRKSQSKTPTPTPSLPVSGIARSLKRRASTISNASIESSQPSASFVKNTPAPAKAAKHQGGQDTRHRESSQATQTSQSNGITTRKAKAVVVHRSEGSQLSLEQDNGQTDADELQIASQLGEAAASPERPILTPRSILGRLRNVLSDFKGMLMGSQEEKEFDDVLFELRRETHEAARRGREA